MSNHFNLLEEYKKCIIVQWWSTESIKFKKKCRKGLKKQVTYNQNICIYNSKMMIWHLDK